MKFSQHTYVMLCSIYYTYDRTVITELYIVVNWGTGKQGYSYILCRIFKKLLKT